MARKGSTIQVMEDTSMDRLLARGISKLAPLCSPWIVVGLAAGGAAIFHHMWGSAATAPWAAIGLTAGTMVLTGLTYLVSRDRRGPIGRVHNTTTTLLAGAWVTAATITGVGEPATKSLAVLGGVVLALSWNIRHVIRETAGDGVSDPLNFLFNQSKERFGLEGAQAYTRKAGPHKIEGALALPAGEKSVEDVQKKIEYVEGGMGLPPGSIGVAPNEDRADYAHVTISDPRVMKRPIPWPGPSLPGRSISEPLRPGLWQDLDPVEHVFIGHHLQIMGMVGSGKSIGGAWNYLAEIVPRIDAAVFAADLTKGEQTLGPLRPALHRFETTKRGVRSLLADLYGEVKPRTDYLSGKGLQKWVPGCGLLYWYVWLEEFPDVGDAVEMDLYLRFLKACRSAGMSVIMSLQRSDYSQMPTLARGQLAKMCFGVAEADDADFGLSDAQGKRGARPELWQNKQPGMAYLDAPSIPDERIAMPLRTYSWGATDEEANANMAAYAAAYPATAKQADPFTAKVMTPGGAGSAASATATMSRPVVLTPGQPATAPTPGPVPAGPVPPGAADVDDLADDLADEDDEEEIKNVASEYLKTDDPNPDNQAGPDDPIDDAGYDGFEFTPPPPPEVELDPAQARAALLDLICQWAAEGRDHFTTKDLQPFLERIGRKRQWAQKEYKPLIADGVISEYDVDIGGYQILRRPEAAA